MKQFFVLVLVLTLAAGASVAMTAHSITAAANRADYPDATPRAIWLRRPPVKRPQLLR